MPPEGVFEPLEEPGGSKSRLMPPRGRRGEGAGGEK